MKKLLPYGLLIILAITFFACGKEDDNIDSPMETETDMQAEFEPDVSASHREAKTLQTVEDPFDAAVATPKVEVTSSVEPETKTSLDSEIEVETETASTTESTSEPETDVLLEREPESEPRTGITFNEDGSITVGHDTIAQLLEEESELIDAMGLTDEQLDALIGDDDVTISPELQDKLLKYVGTLPLTDQLRLLGKISELME